MFIGHYGVGFAIRAIDKRIPLWMLFIAVQFVDVLWAVFVLAGIEKVRIVPGITATNPLDLYYMPYTHSLAGALFWSVVGCGMFWIFRKNEPGGDSRVGSSALIGLAVFSHWILDLIVHRPDLPLYNDSFKMGFGLWNSPVIAFGLEIFLLFGGMLLYLRSTTAANAVGKFGMPVLGLVLIAIQSVVFFGAPPSSASAAALTALIAYFVFAGVVFWLERRAPLIYTKPISRTILTRMIRYLFFLLVVAGAYFQLNGQSFVSAKNQTFQLNNRPYYFVGTNYWYGSLLGLEKDNTRGIERLRNELDFLKANGVTNLRLMAGAEGAGTINGVERVGPALQPELRKFDPTALDGLDLVLAEMGKRRMTAVVFFSNNWEWSGGFLQYVIWRQIVPPDMRERKLTWDELRDMGARFYVCSECKFDYLKHVNFVLDRTNAITGVKYTDDPTIMAWEIANEPRPMRPGANELYAQFIRDAAAAIKSRDKNHLVTIGHEGSIGTESMELFERVHADPNIDYLTIHIWPKNWGWMDNAVEKSAAYIEEHIVVARRLKKPLVIEEFGFPRNSSPPRRGDAEKGRVGDTRGKENHPVAEAATPLLRKEGSFLFAPGSPTSLRDAYYRKILSYIGKDVAGANFWAFGGTARPIAGQTFWKRGDEWMGDPPMEEQGLNSVFDVDQSTWRVIRAATKTIGGTSNRHVR